MTLREVQRVLAAGGEPPARSPLRDGREIEGLLAGVPPPVADLDHVPATAETVLARVRYLHEHYELERCRVLLLGDHDATSLAFGALGAAVRELAVVDVDQRQLAYLSSHGVDTWFADLRVGLPAPLRDRFDLVLTDPPYSPAGIGLFAARALEALKRESRLLVAYGYPEGSPALGLKVQAELSALELVYEAVLPDFNAYAGALAVGSRAALYVLRPTKRSRRIAVRRGARHAEAMYTRGRQAVESRAAGAAPPELSELEGEPGALYFGPGWPRPLSELLEAPRPAPAVFVNLGPELVYSLYQAAVAAVAERVVIVAHNRTEGLRTAEEQARLRAVVAPRYEVVTLARSWRGSAFTLVELRGEGAPRDERAVYREATSTAIASEASGAPQPSSDAGASVP